MSVRYWRWSVLVLALLSACALAPTPDPANSVGQVNPAPTPDVAPSAEVDLKNHGPAPELTNTVWLNVDQPLRLADLRGQVVLIDMWTFG